jgi:hypothetical protein
MLAKLVTVTDVLTKNPRPISVLRIVAVPDVLIDAVVTLAVGAVVSPIARIGRTPWVKYLPQLSFPHVPSALGKFHVSASVLAFTVSCDELLKVPALVMLRVALLVHI